jgi:hypothetical protein
LEAGYQETNRKPGKMLRPIEFCTVTRHNPALTNKEVTKMKERNSKISRIASSTMIVCGVLVSVSPGWAQSASGFCSNQILRGNYGFSVEGVVTPAPGVQVPIRGVAMTNFDGQGNLTQVDHVVIPGSPPPALDWTKGTGTYHVNPDCTGTAHIDVPSTGDFVNLRFVVAALGNQIHTVVVAPFSGPDRAVTSVGIRLL